MSTDEPESTKLAREIDVAPPVSIDWEREAAEETGAGLGTAVSDLASMLSTLASMLSAVATLATVFLLYQQITVQKQEADRVHHAALIATLYNERCWDRQNEYGKLEQICEPLASDRARAEAIEALVLLGERNLNHANAPGANLNNVTNRWSTSPGAAATQLEYADLRDANLSYTDLSWSYLKGANLTGADLTNADLSWAWMDSVNLTDADLTGANLSAAKLPRANLTNADLRDTDLDGANLRFALRASGNRRVPGWKCELVAEQMDLCRLVPDLSQAGAWPRP